MTWRDEAFIVRPVAYSSPRNELEESANRAVMDLYLDSKARENLSIACLTLVGDDYPEWIRVIHFGWTTEGFRVFTGSYNYETYEAMRQVMAVGLMDLQRSIAKTPLDDIDPEFRDNAIRVKRAMKETDCGDPTCAVHGGLDEAGPMTVDEITEQDPPMSEWKDIAWVDPGEREDPA